MRVKTLDSATGKLTDRRKKCVSEHYVKERKSNANRQFSYNKLINEQNALRKSKPNRPPQPKVKNVDENQEGMLIDLSPTDGIISLSDTTKNQSIHSSRSSGICLLDEPIEIPTENIFSDEGLSEDTGAMVGDTRERKLEPPPYKNPPTYTNTIEFSRNVPKSPKNTTLRKLQNVEQLSDPFNTTSQTCDNQFNIYLNTENTTSNSGNMSVSDINNLSRMVGSLNVSSSMNRTPSPAQSIQIQTLNDFQLASSNDNSLSDSLKVNLSSNTGDDSFDIKNSPMKLDKSFLTELEKNLYKNERENKNLNLPSEKYTNCMNNTSIYQKSFSNLEKMSNINSMTNEPSSSNSTNLLQSPQSKKCTNTTKSINHELSNYVRNLNENTYTNVNNVNNVNYKNYFTLPSGGKQSNVSNYGDTSSIINQIWMETALNPQNIQNNTQASSSNTHNFVAISNRQLIDSPKKESQTSHSQLQSQNSNHLNDRSNIYSSVAGDMYSSVIYDKIGASNYAGLYSNDMSMIQNTASSLPIYDEVAELRPHRPAPIIPPNQILSAQQIQRRLEKQQQQQIYGNMVLSDNLDESQKISAFLREAGEDVREQEARQFLISSNWDQLTAVKNFKIEKLTRLVFFFFNL